MFIIWYTLLNFINLMFTIIRVFFKLLRLDTTLLSLLSGYFSVNTCNNESNLQSSTNLNFKNLYSEYKFFSKNNSSLTLADNILVNFNNTKLFNNYSYFNNFFINNLQQNKNINISTKLNLNYLNSQFKVNLTNLQLNKFKSQYIQLIKSNLNIINNSIVVVNNTLKNSISQKWIIKYSPSNFMKYINLSNFQNYTILFLRKNKVFNKGRYSRNRQYYRTGVYWCLYINIVAVIGIHFWFYKLTMNFGYLWWLLYAFIVSFILPKVLKYRLYNVVNLANNLISNFIWLYLICYYYLQLILIKVNNLLSSNKLLTSNFFSVNNNIFITYISSILYLFSNKYINFYEYNYINTYYNTNNYLSNIQYSLTKFFSNSFKI